MTSVYSPDLLTEGFEAKCGHRRAVAYRMLGSLSEADDAVQEAWLRLSHLVEPLLAWSEVNPPGASLV